MRYFTIEQRESLQSRLTERATALHGAIAAALRRTESPTRGGLMDRFEATGELPAAGLESCPDSAALERDARELRAVREALYRLHTPEFGYCADCGAEIPFSRLGVDPLTERCASCQARAENAEAELHGV